MKLQIKKPVNMTARKPHVYCKRYVPLLESSVMMYFSGGGVGKSWASIHTAVEFVEENQEKKAVLWLTEDAEGETRDRYERIIKGRRHTRDFYDTRVHFIQQEPLKLTKLTDGNAIITDEFWDIRLDLMDYSLVVFDPLLQFNGGDENNNTHAGILMGALKTWAAEENKVILLLHHATVKMDGSPKSRGAGEWMNGCRGVYEVAMVLDDKGQVDTDRKNKRNFKLAKDNGLSYHFRDVATGLLERSLIVFPPQDDIKEEVVNPPDKVFISLAPHNDAKNPKGFEKKKINFSDLHKVVTYGGCYSPYIFANGHRLSSNNLGGADLMCFDFDNGLTLAEGFKRFSKYQSLLVTTRSHGPKGDRFRAFVKLKTPLHVPEFDYADFMDALFNKIGDVDPATKDLARFYFASPSNAEYMYTDGTDLFDWVPVYEEMKKKKVIQAITKKRVQKVDFTNYNPSNTLPPDTLFTTRNGGGKTFADLKRSLSIGDKEVVQCRQGYGHNNGQGPEHNAAAFVKMANNGNVFYHCSGAKCAGDEALWCEE